MYSFTISIRRLQLFVCKDRRKCLRTGYGYECERRNVSKEMFTGIINKSSFFSVQIETHENKINKISAYKMESQYKSDNGFKIV